MMVFKRNLLFQGLLFRFHVKLPERVILYVTVAPPEPQKIGTLQRPSFSGVWFRVWDQPELRITHVIQTLTGLQPKRKEEPLAGIHLRLFFSNGIKSGANSVTSNSVGEGVVCYIFFLVRVILFFQPLRFTTF